MPASAPRMKSLSLFRYHRKVYGEWQLERVRLVLLQLGRPLCLLSGNLSSSSKILIRCLADQLSNELKAQYKSENLFPRGYFYWMLLRHIRTISVKLTGTVSQDEDMNKYPRAPFDTCVKFINENDGWRGRRTSFRMEFLR